MGHQLLSVLPKLHNQPVLLCPVQCHLQKDLREDTYLQVELGPKAAHQQTVLDFSGRTYQLHVKRSFDIM